MTARSETRALGNAIYVRTEGEVDLSFDDANTLRKAQKTLHRWAELECGTTDGHIEQDEKTGQWRFYNARARYLDPNDPRAWSRIQDRETDALKRIAAVCQANGLHFYHQTDPRGCALYVAREPLTDQNYSSAGVACV